jgi:hypothetical protein
MVHKSPSRVHHRDLRLLLYDAPIKQVKTHRYLGITIDPKFNFEINAVHTTQRARNITLGLRRRAARHWGQSAPATLRAIYRGAILPILTYASPVWISTIRRSKVNRKYLSLYGTFARLLTNSYVSVSTDAAGVLAGILPIDLEIERANTLRALKRGRVSMYQVISTPWPMPPSTCNCELRTSGKPAGTIQQKAVPLMLFYLRSPPTLRRYRPWTL